ncbi:MAG TPA: hypothetical protein DEA47_00470 [Peptococcaceae bacterium]|nr:MAG: Putative membrane protein, required for colicin V production [Clostridia bacterium 41_269]HBT19846.1 hypothetical protein [Peptococcaceae bacterium]
MMSIPLIKSAVFRILGGLGTVNLLDWAVLIFVLLGAFRGYRRGLLAGIMGFVGYIFSASLAGYFTPQAVAWAEKRGIFVNWAFQFFESCFNPTSAAGTGFSQTDLSLWSMHGEGMMGILKFLQEMFSRPPGELEAITKVFYREITAAAVSMMVFSVLLVFFIFLVRFMIRVLQNGMRGTFLGTLNRIGGFIAGGAVNAFLSLLFFFILTPFLAVGAAAHQGILYNFYELFKESVFVSYLFKFLSSVKGGF